MSNVKDKSTKDDVKDITDDGGIMDHIDNMDDTSNTCIVKVTVTHDMEEPAYEPINSDLIKQITGLETSNELDDRIADLSQSNK